MLSTDLPMARTRKQRSICKRDTDDVAEMLHVLHQSREKGS